MKSERERGGIWAEGDAQTAHMPLHENPDLNNAISGICRLIARISDAKRIPNKSTIDRIGTLSQSLSKIIRSTAQLQHKHGQDYDPAEDGDPSHYRAIEAAIKDKHQEIVRRRTCPET